MEPYIRKINYHETDKMGITHHSNYIKLMEEARVDFLDKIGYGYARLEAEGIISPVIAIECEYKSPTTFDDVLEITVGVEELKGVRLTISYTMVNKKTGAVVLIGRSKHCFLGTQGKPIALKKKFPALDAALKSFLPREDN